MFDRYIALGYECESVVQMRRLSGSSQASVLDWQRLHHDPLAGVLRTDFANYFELENLLLSEDRKYVLDTATGIEFHHLFTQNFDTTILPQRIRRDYPHLRARMDYLLRRWRENTGSRLSTLYVRRDPLDMFTAENMVELRDCLHKCYPSHRFALVWVRGTDPDGCHADGAVELSEGVYSTTVPVAQPREVRWQGDDADWDRVFPALQRLRPLDC